MPFFQCEETFWEISEIPRAVLVLNPTAPFREPGSKPVGGPARLKQNQSCNFDLHEPKTKSFSESMKINSQTKISVIIKHNEAAIEAIASINPHFTKLRNPILRRVLAPRVTVQDAARIGKCEVKTMMQKLAAIGFEVEMDKPGEAPPPKTAASGVDLLIAAAVEAGKVYTLDVRPILAGGKDPFQHIMSTLREVPEGHALEVVNSFEPMPLIKILQKKGYASSVETRGDAVHTFFLKTSRAEEEIAGQPGEWLFRTTLEALEKEREKFAGKFAEVDVRDLEMPLPMVTILNELEALPQGHALYVHHKKMPQYLLPELEERRFKTWAAELGEGNVKLLIHR
jgi:uncharacterized protein (DUF2249 family)